MCGCKRYLVGMPKLYRKLYSVDGLEGSGGSYGSQDIALAVSPRLGARIVKGDRVLFKAAFVADYGRTCWVLVP